MKLRLRGNSLRLRLSQREVSRLLTERRVSESVNFGSPAANLLTYSLEARQHATQVSARFGDGEILVTLPAPLAESWANTDQVGIEHTQSAGDQKGLQIIIEKDFQCLHPRAEEEEDERDNFPHPDRTAPSSTAESTSH